LVSVSARSKHTEIAAWMRKGTCGVDLGALYRHGTRVGKGSRGNRDRFAHARVLLGDARLEKTALFRGLHASEKGGTGPGCQWLSERIGGARVA